MRHYKSTHLCTIPHSYAMYYENLLKNQHSLLYSKEREVVSLKEQLKQKELETDVSVQFQMSEQAHNLLLGKSRYLIPRLIYKKFA